MLTGHGGRQKFATTSSFVRSRSREVGCCRMCEGPVRIFTSIGGIAARRLLVLHRRLDCNDGEDLASPHSPQPGSIELAREPMQDVQHELKVLFGHRRVHAPWRAARAGHLSTEHGGFTKEDGSAGLDRHRGTLQPSTDRHLLRLRTELPRATVSLGARTRAEPFSRRPTSAPRCALPSPENALPRHLG